MQRRLDGIHVKDTTIAYNALEVNELASVPNRAAVLATAAPNVATHAQLDPLNGGATRVSTVATPSLL